MNFEEMTTDAAQVESCLISRPLTAVTNHSQDRLQALTPSHFLIGRAGCAYPELPIKTVPSMYKRWNLCQAIVTHFWRRWSAEYLQQLQRLQKWRKPTTNLKIGDIVLIREDATFTNHWPMVRVLQAKTAFCES